MLGEGDYGEVQLGTWKDRPCAIKTIRATLNHSEQNARVDKWTQEVTMLKCLDHPNIVKMLWNCKKTFEIGFELFPYNLKAYWYQEEPEESVVQCWLQQIAAGLAFAHSQGIVHRDIRLDNCLISETNHVVLANWGNARPVRSLTKINQLQKYRQDVESFGELLMHGKMNKKRLEVYTELDQGEFITACDFGKHPWFIE